MAFHQWDDSGPRVHASSGADPGFLESGFICIMVWGFADFISFFLNIPLRIFKNWGRGGGSIERFRPPLE